MKAIDRQFTQIINGTTQFIIPVFQRDYSWTESQCEQLWRDIVRVAAGDAEATHFLGSVVYAPTGDSSAGFTRWLLIDGQQRVTTLILLLIALREHLHETKWKGGEDDPTVARINAYFLCNLQEEGSRKNKLVLRRRDQDTLVALIDRQPPPDRPSERIHENFEYFRDQISRSDPSFVYRGVGRLVVVDVTLSGRADNPQLVFESLNSTGIDLSQSDLIRNFILMRLPERDQTRLYESYWSRIELLFRGSERDFDAFARDFMALKTRASKQEKAEDIYRRFRDFYSKYTRELDGDEAALGELLRYAQYYASFTSGVGAPPSLATRLARLRQLVDVPALLVMRLFDCYDRVGSLSESGFSEALLLLESYVFRRAICGLQTRGYWQVFANIAYRISDENPLDDLLVALARQHDTSRFPSDTEFRRGLVERDLYGVRVGKILLDTLENHGSREPTNTGAYSIEHVMPQNRDLPLEWRQMLGEDWERVQQTWLHRIGNLTLTGYNSTYSDRPFEEKKTIAGGFAESALRLNRFIREQPEWTERVIERRGELLADQALTIWPPLQVEEAAIMASRNRELRELSARRDVNKIKMTPRAKELFDSLSEAIRELDEAIIEVGETNSISYYEGTRFFVEVLPRKSRLTLLLPLDFHEIEDPRGIAEDATQWKFFFHAQHEAGVALRIDDIADIPFALNIIQYARSVAAP